MTFCTSVAEALVAGICVPQGAGFSMLVARSDSTTGNVTSIIYENQELVVRGATSAAWMRVEHLTLVEVHCTLHGITSHN